LWSAASPTAHRSVSIYDADGNPTSQTDGAGNTTTSTFDAAGQLTKTTRPDGTTQQSSFHLTRTRSPWTPRRQESTWCP
jgi:YD repeat-containing protein